MDTPLKTRLAFVDDHPTLLTGLATIFASDPRYEIVGTGMSAAEAVEIGRSGRADVLILDLSMPGDVFGAIEELTRDIPLLKLVVFTAFANVDLALKALALIHPRKCDVVELRFFGGLNLEETAVALHISVDTVKRDWRFAKLWLLRELEGQR